jgi:aspartate ammonia-lyase
MSKEVRIEKDFLGTKEVPIAAYYGIQTLRAVENFPITGYHIHEELIIALAIVKKAAALANMKIKQLTPKLGNAIVESATEIIEGKWHDHFIVDPIQGGAGTSINMNANEMTILSALHQKQGNWN